MRLLLRHFTASVGASLLVAIVVLVVVTTVALVPRALAAMASAELRGQMQSIAPEQRDPTAEGIGPIITELQPHYAATQEDFEIALDAWRALGVEGAYRPMEEAIAEIRAEQAPVLRDLLGEGDYYSRTEPIPTPPAVPDRDAPIMQTTVAVDPRIEQRVTLVEGSFPEPWVYDSVPVPLMLSVQTAEAMRWSVGETRDRVGQQVVLSGTFEPIDASAPYWRHAPGVLEPQVLDDGNSTPQVTGIAYVNPLTITLSRGAQHTTVWYPMEVEGLDFADAAALAPELRTFTDQPQLAPVPIGTPLSLAFDSGAVDVLDTVLGRASTTASVLAMVASGPLGVVLAVFALGARSVVERRRSALALASARGASGLQLRGAMALEGALVGILPAAAGIVIAALVLPGPQPLAAFVAPVLLGLAPAVLFAASARPASLRSTRDDLGSSGRFRWIVEVLIVGLAGLALFLLVRRGLTTSSAVGLDPLLAATPLLLALAVCVGVLRLYPLPLLALSRRLRRRGGLTGFLGATRAVRERTLALAAVLALVVGVSVAVFSSVLLTTLDRGVSAGAAGVIGGDLRVEGPVFDEDAVAGASGVEGVQGVSGIDTVGPAALRIDKVRTTVTLFVVDGATLAAFREVPAGFGEREGESIPIVISEGLAESVAGADLLLEGEPATVAAVADSTTGYGAVGDWVLVDRAFTEDVTGNAFLPRLLLVDLASGADARAVAEAMEQLGGPTTTVTSLDDAIAEARSAPTTAGLRLALILAVAAIAALAALAIVLSTAIGAESRNRILGLLRTLGLSGRQSSGLVAWELAPPAIVAVVAGTLLGLALPWAVIAAVDLRPFTGGAAQPAPSVDPVLIAGVLGAVLIAVLVASAIAIAIARRRSPATTLRMGAD